MLLTRINVIEELQRFDTKFEYASDREVRILCPFHPDSRPSCSVNLENRKFKCWAAHCGAHGDFITLAAKIAGADRDKIALDLASRYGGTDDRIVEPEVIERWHAQIWQAFPLLKELEKRAITRDAIRKYRLGECRGRVSIPIKNEVGQFVNVRRYAPGLTSGPKFTNMRGRGEIRLFPIDQLKYDDVLICGGEIKAIAASEILNSRGIGAVASTGGEGNWDRTFTERFVGKRVWVCYDVDSAGRVAAAQRCATLRRVAQWVGDVVLPLDVDEFPHGDVNDFIAAGGDLYALLQETPEWAPPEVGADSEDPPEKIHLPKALDPTLVDRRVQLGAMVSMVNESPYFLPKRVRVTCDRDQKLCAICPIMQLEDEPVVPVPKESETTLEMVASNRVSQKEALRKALKIPQCKVVEFGVEEYSRVDECVVTNPLDLSNVLSEKTAVRAYFIDAAVDLNCTYSISGKMLPHPKTQSATMVASEAEAVEDQLTAFKLEDPEALRVFTPSSWSKLDEHLDHLYAEMAAHVTHIYQRDAIHALVDFAYHSPLMLRVEGRDVKGWVEVLVVGDSAQGKSETTLRMAEHYGLGEKVESKNASIAGLLGGLVKSSDRWFVQWGVIPTHDRRLVILEEIKGMRKDVLAKLTDMRSSGVAEIPKIERRKTHARTRLVVISNPRSGYPVASYAHGVDVIRELIMNPEDIRRFDVAMIVAAEEVPLDLRRVPSMNGGLKFTRELCRRLILWAWTRTPDQVNLDMAWHEICDAASRLCDEFSDEVPIVDRGSMRFKLARLSASLACRTFSTEDYEIVIVRPEHVLYVERFLKRIYTTRAFGYDRFSAASKSRCELKDVPKILREISTLPFADAFIEGIMSLNEIEIQDICDWSGWDRVEALALVSFLVRHNAIFRDRRYYRKTPAFMALLREAKITRPAHIEEEF